MCGPAGGSSAGVVVVYIATSDLSSADQQVGQAVHSALSQEFLTIHAGKIQKAYREKRFDAGKWSGTVPIEYRITQRERHACDQRAVRSADLEDQVGAWLASVEIPADWQTDIERLQRREAQVERLPSTLHGSNGSWRTSVISLPTPTLPARNTWDASGPYWRP